MNLILYEKIPGGNTELKEYLKNKSGVNVYAASSKEEVIKLFGKLKIVEWLVVMDVSLPSDLGVVQYIKKNYEAAKIIFIASPIIKESIEIIKNSELILMDNSFDRIKEINDVIKSNS